MVSKKIRRQRNQIQSSNTNIQLEEYKTVQFIVMVLRIEIPDFLFLPTVACYSCTLAIREGTNRFGRFASTTDHCAIETLFFYNNFISKDCITPPFLCILNKISYKT